MANLVEMHILQNFAPSNLNRDDTGSPKDAIFGGYRRARVSSQCLKRSARQYVRDHPNGLPADALALRTKLAVKELVKALAAKGRDAGEAETKVIAALEGVGLKIGRDERTGEYQTEYLLFVGQHELDRLTDLIDEHWDRLAATEAEAGGARQTGRAAKRAGRAAVPPEVATALGKVLDGGKAVDLALFGRMLADLPQKNQDAACQVAHALSTHSVEREFDFYTAVDDFKERDETADAGAGMMGTIEFTSACFYRYVALDLEQLRRNLQGDTELARLGVAALLRALVKAKPTGKQNSFAAHNDPAYIVCTVRRDADPRNLANAFECPVTKRDWTERGQPIGLTAASVRRFEHAWRQLETAYGEAGPTFTLDLTKDKDERALGEPVASLDALIDRTMASVDDALGV